MAVVSMKALLESGVHFGHQTRRWNPKMAQYIFTARNGIHIIDLQKTMQRVKVAHGAMKDLASNNGKVLFVGTKKQAQGAIVEYAQKCGMFYVAERWLGGLLTNFKTVSKSIERLKELEKMQATDIWEAETKKERLDLQRELDKKNKILAGIKDMKKLPDALFIIDPKRESIAVNEAHKLGIPIFAVVDTNCNPDEVDFPIPGNDDAIRAIALFLDVMVNAIVEGQSGGQADLVQVEDEEGLVESEETELDVPEPDSKPAEETAGEDAPKGAVKADAKDSDYGEYDEYDEKKKTW
ncbi:MAG: 30S ribosomal protein S2 [Spirochaetae bacterium HGW-Spirochaetae-1]|nr:MAG: 30S ribosomal protein S2 [Spirochaetae bacterium HGW-Spirochaetae-1]